MPLLESQFSSMAMSNCLRNTTRWDSMDDFVAEYQCITDDDMLEKLTSVLISHKGTPPYPCGNYTGRYTATYYQRISFWCHNADKNNRPQHISRLTCHPLQIYGAISQTYSRENHSINGFTQYSSNSHCLSIATSAISKLSSTHP
jgi:hypothetical protein